MVREALVTREWDISPFLCYSHLQNPFQNIYHFGCFGSFRHIGYVRGNLESHGKVTGVGGDYVLDMSVIKHIEIFSFEGHGPEDILL